MGAAQKPAIAAAQKSSEKTLSLLTKFGERYSVEPNKVYSTLEKTAFADASSTEQVIALLIVADQYGLNPFTGEIFAFPDKKGGVVPVVGIDGWNRIAQQHPQFDGVELEYADELVDPPGGKGKRCPEWMEACVYRKDREHPIVIREYLDECYQPPRGGHNGPWQSHTKRMLRHKTLIQAYRVAFGFHGIYDPDEAERIADAREIDITPTPPPEEGRLGFGSKAQPEAIEQPEEETAEAAEESESGQEAAETAEAQEEGGTEEEAKEEAAESTEAEEKEPELLDEAL